MHWLISREACVPRTRLDTEHVIIMHRPKRSVSHYDIVMLTLSHALAMPNPRICGDWSLRFGVETRPITRLPIVCPAAVVYE